MLENKNKQKDILQGEDTVKFIKFLQLRWYGHVEITENQSVPKTNCNSCSGRNKGKRIPHERWRDEVEEDLGIRGVKKQTGKARDFQEWRKMYWKPKSTVNCST
jgi:hypothetical protein